MEGKSKSEGELLPGFSTMIMPALAIGTVLELFGLGGPVLALAGWGLERMVELAKVFAGWPQAVQVVASAPDWTLAVSFLGLLFVCLWQGRARWLGLIALAAVAIWPRPPTPNVWIAAGGTNIAVSEAGHSLVFEAGCAGFRTRAVVAAARPGHAAGGARGGLARPGLSLRPRRLPAPGRRAHQAVGLVAAQGARAQRVGGSMR